MPMHNHAEYPWTEDNARCPECQGDEYRLKATADSIEFHCDRCGFEKTERRSESIWRDIDTIIARANKCPSCGSEAVDVFAVSGNEVGGCHECGAAWDTRAPEKYVR